MLNYGSAIIREPPSLATLDVMTTDPQSLIGQSLPAITLLTMRDGKPTPVGADEFAKGNWVIVGVPGAFTPTCHARHLPGFVDSAAEFAAKNYSVAFLTTNDVFVTHAWGESNKADDILMLADSDNSASAALGLSLDLTKTKMGMRTERFAMVLNNGIIAQLEIDSAGSFGKTSAETVLAAI